MNPDLSDVRAADPVRLADLPSSRSPEAQALLAETMASATPAAAQGRSRLPLLGAVAAAFLLVVGFAIFAPSNSTSALATVKAAAQKASAADSGRIVTTFNLDNEADGILEVKFNDDDLSAVVRLNNLPAEFRTEGGALLDGVETRLVDGVVYIKGGPAPDWVAIEVPQMFTDQLNTINPRELLQTIQTLVDADEIATDEIDGAPVTVYRSLVDLSDEKLSTSGWLAGFEEQIALEADGELTVDLYVDGNDELRRVDVVGKVVDAQGEAGSATLSITTVFSDLNEIGPITPPAGVTPNSLLEGMFEGADN